MVSNLHRVTQHVRSRISVPDTVLFRSLSPTVCVHKAVLLGREREKDMLCHRRGDAKGTPTSHLKVRALQNANRTSESKLTSEPTSQTRGRKMGAHRD